ncbi:MAG: hypothetical protein ACRDUW_17715, partial [Pseudonocardiaceae bacterium]
EGRRLHELNDLLPNWFMRHRTLSCPWERKGLVMRTLVDEYHDHPLELFDGVRVGVDGGWFLVLPDASEPTLNVYAEGPDGERADRLIDDVCGHIAALVEA